jgi:hypothetical protein
MREQVAGFSPGIIQTNIYSPYAKLAISSVIKSIKYPISKFKTPSMSFFNFFRKNRIFNESANTGNHSAAADIKDDLFISDEEPERANELMESTSLIDKFVSQNFEQKGCACGYLYPDNTILESNLKLILSDFRMVIDRTIDLKRTEVNEIKISLIKIAGISLNMESQLSEKQKQLESSIHELDVQKILSVEDEGIITSSISAYRSGFLRGVEQYHQEKLIGKSTGLFN